MEKKVKWTVKDIITTVLLSVMLIVMQLAINMICMVNHFVSMVMSVGISCLICAPVYFIMLRRVKKRFVSLIYMLLLGLVFTMMGDWFLLPYFAVIGCIVEAILWKAGSYDSARKISTAWTVYSALYIGVNLLPMWFFMDRFKENAVSAGMTEDYINSYMSYYSSPGWLVLILAFTALCGVVGSLIGSKMMKKHFKNAGVL